MSRVTVGEVFVFVVCVVEEPRRAVRRARGDRTGTGVSRTKCVILRVGHTGRSDRRDKTEKTVGGRSFRDLIDP